MPNEIFQVLTPNKPKQQTDFGLGSIHKVRTLETIFWRTTLSRLILNDVHFFVHVLMDCPFGKLGTRFLINTFFLSVSTMLFCSVYILCFCFGQNTFLYMFNKMFLLKFCLKKFLFTSIICFHFCHILHDKLFSLYLHFVFLRKYGNLDYFMLRSQENCEKHKHASVSLIPCIMEEWD